ncbi:CoA pyrophosphatase [Thermomonas sp.]|jgi:8-oxo-dGTP pyrophosphatase MutT (NUDIX family)|uniref:NUDIX hydrolase n=1 Tax=Thermomonas sp. TaxID=1971895 RepID=UPI002D1FC0EF|nr:CoA pyrophosphatase [Thermomonas sp.]
MSADVLLARLRKATHPLSAPPQAPAWNLAELDGLPLPAVPRQAAVLVGIIPRSTGAEVLLTRRTEMLRQHAGQVSFPGGSIEQGDLHPADAALREAREEVGLLPTQAQALGYLDPLLTLTGFRIVPTVVWVDPAFQAQPDPSEVADVFAVSLDLLMDPAQLETIELEFGGRARHVFQYRYQHQRIWGVTASILYNLRQRLAGAPIGRL